MPRSSSRGRWSTNSALSISFAASRFPRLKRSSNQRRASVLFCSDISSSVLLVVPHQGARAQRSARRGLDTLTLGKLLRTPARRSPLEPPSHRPAYLAALHCYQPDVL